MEPGFWGGLAMWAVIGLLVMAKGTGFWGGLGRLTIQELLVLVGLLGVLSRLTLGAFKRVKRLVAAERERRLLRRQFKQTQKWQRESHAKVDRILTEAEARMNALADGDGTSWRDVDLR